jgi:type IV secretory pathway TrbF-like protein
MFSRPTVRYGATPPVETPYQRAGQVWDDRIGSARVQAKNWRLAFFGALLMSGGLAAGLIWQSAHGTVTPWVVEVDKLGQAEAVAPAVADYRATDPQIAWYLSHFVEWVRTVPPDPVAQRKDWLEAYDFADDKGQQALSDYARTGDPFSKGQHEQVSVDISTTVSASSGSSIIMSMVHSPIPNAGAPFSPSSCRRRPTKTGSRRILSASTSMPSTGPRS